MINKFKFGLAEKEEDVKAVVSLVSRLVLLKLA